MIKTLAPNSICLIGPGRVSVTNGNLLYRWDGDPIRLKTSFIGNLFAFGSVQFSTEALGALMNQGVSVSLFSPKGRRCHGRIQSSESKSTRLRVLQHRYLSHSSHSLEMARWIVDLKIQSFQKSYRRWQRHGTSLGRIPKATTKLQKQLSNCTSVDSVRGIEGAATLDWYRLFRRLVQKPWIFRKRIRRPAPDPVNSLLGLASALTLEKTVAMANAYGLEINLGALHTFVPGRPSLACDLMEPLRVDAIDRWVLAVTKSDFLQPIDFQRTDGGCKLRQAVFGRTIASWEQNWTDNDLSLSLCTLVQDCESKMRTT